LKIRVLENAVCIDTFKALGANAVPMAWTEALTALQQGSVDGQENPINVAAAFKLYETQKYVSMTKHTYSPAAFLMSKKVFDGFSKEDQAILTKAALEASQYERKWIADQVASQVKELKEKGMQFNEPDLAPFKAAVKPVYEKYGSKFATILADIEKAKK
jgi:TRAP-type C4-dicarboxylate transport system substrate-binding protein